MPGWTQEGAQKGPGLIVIVKREKMSKSLNLMQNGPNPNSNRKRDKMLKSLNLMERRTQEGTQKGLGPHWTFEKKKFILGIFSASKTKIYLGPYSK